MNTVQPIRDHETIVRLKEYLKIRSRRDWFMFELGLNVGLRISDLLKLRVKTVKNRSHMIIREEKTGKEKRLKINAMLRATIEEYTDGMNDEDYLFTSLKGKNKPITRIQAYRILNVAAKEFGIDEIGTHTLRKTFGYHFYQKTKDVAILQEIFNHSSPSITLRYIGINQDIMDESMNGFYI